MSRFAETLDRLMATRDANEERVGDEEVRSAEHLEVHAVGGEGVGSDDLHAELRFWAEVEAIAEERDAEREASLGFRGRGHAECGWTE